MDLPTLDFSDFLQGSDVKRRELATALVASFQKHGFVKLINHGLPEQTVKDFQSATKQLFGLSTGAKEKFKNVKGPHPQRGWSYKGAEVTAKLFKSNVTEGNGDDLKDEREFFDAGPPGDSEYPNKWPLEDLREFQPLVEECYELLQRVSLQILEAMEVGLDLSPGTLRHRCMPAASEIRLNYYPPVSLDVLGEGKIKRTWPHTDFGIITLLFQDTTGGLELEDRSRQGQFVPVSPGSPDAASEMVVNISDTFERWSNGVIRAGVHRVDVPQYMKAREKGTCPARYSSVFFFKAARNTCVGPLPAFVCADRPAKFEDITALQYQQQRTSILY